MPDMEKVIKAVEEAFDLVHSDFIGTDDFNETEWEQNKADALALLKEQKEAKTGHWNGSECSHCHAVLERKPKPGFFKYCPYCGAKWTMRKDGEVNGQGNGRNGF